MSFTCSLCQFDFKYKQSLQKHLKEQRCTSSLLTNWEELNNKIYNLEKKYTILEEKYNNLLHKPPIPSHIESSSQFISGGNYNKMMNFNIKIEINPITNLKLDYIEPNIMKELVETYDFSQNKNPQQLNLLLSNYIKNFICNKDHPENHAVKYIKKKPPTYNCTIKDENGNTIQVIKQLKDTCELLSDPMLNNLKIKLNEFLKKYKKDEEFDFEMYEDTIKQLRKELNKKTVKKALSSVLQNNIINDIKMKFDISMNDIIK
jgi:hypothetical protein